MNGHGTTLIEHLEALRRSLLLIAAAMFLALPLTYWASSYAIEWLVKWCFPDGGELYFFSPMEAFWAQLKLALVMALALTYPWNVFQLWKFVHPALYPKERRALGGWIMLSSLLFFGGGVFCVGAILPLVVRFATGFASPSLKPLIGLESFLELAGWLTFAFALMFQTPIVVYMAVRMGFVSSATLAAKRPYVVVVILVVAALLTPPDVISQVMLGIPTWLLFEVGLLMARLAEKRAAADEKE